MTTIQWYDLPQSERDFWIADWLLDRAACPQCGRDPEVCGDAHRAWFPQRSVCHARMAVEAISATFKDIHEDAPYHDGTFKSWSEKRSEFHPYHYSWGVNLWVAEEDLSPGDNFLTPVNEWASPEQQ